MSQMFNKLSVEEAEKTELVPALYATEAELVRQTLEDWKKPQNEPARIQQPIYEKIAEQFNFVQEQIYKSLK